MSSSITRWEKTNGTQRYGARFAKLRADGEDITGEARLADAIAPRGATILDAGSGMGRIGGHLVACGHAAYGVDLDGILLEQSRDAYPNFPVAQARLDELTPTVLESTGFPRQFDVIVCVGNVMILLAPDSEREVLSRLRALLAPHGRLIVGFSTDGAPPDSRVYPAAEFERDAAAAGLRMESRFASYDLSPADDDDRFAVYLLQDAAAESSRKSG